MYYVVKKQPANVTCEAYGATRITFTCAGSEIPASSQRTYETYDESRGDTLVRSSIQVTRSDLANQKEGEDFWCECTAMADDIGVSVTSRRAVISLSCEYTRALCSLWARFSLFNAPALSACLSACLPCLSSCLPCLSACLSVCLCLAPLCLFVSANSTVSVFTSLTVFVFFLKGLLSTPLSSLRTIVHTHPL